MKIGLYGLPVEGAEFQSWCGGNLGGSNETCVKVAEIPGAPGTFVVQDSKADGAGRELRFTANELDSFTEGWTAFRSMSA